MTIVMRGMALTPGTAASTAVVTAGLEVEITTEEITVSLSSAQVSASLSSPTLTADYLETTQAVALPSNTLTAKIDSSIQL